MGNGRGSGLVLTSELVKLESESRFVNHNVILTAKRCFSWRKKEK